MANDKNKESDVYKYYLELSKPTEEDFQRVFTDEELKQLCLKHQCRVDIWRWNVVNDYRRLFINSGRYQRWSDRKRVLMLAKSVNKMKPSVLYDEEEIERTRKEEWGLQLKENILSLNYWKRKKLHALNEEIEPIPLLHVSDTGEIDEEIQSQCAVNTESMNENEIYTQSQWTQPALEVDHVQIPTTITAAKASTGQFANFSDAAEIDKEIQSQCAVNTESMNGNEIYTQSQRTQPTLEVDYMHSPTANTKSIKSTTTALSKESDEGVLLSNLDEDSIIEDSEDSTETVLLQHQPKATAIVVQPLQTLQSEEVAPEIENIYGVDTMSMTIDTQFSTQTENVVVLQSEDVILENYDYFKTIIPLTSTQSQGNVSEEIEII